MLLLPGMIATETIMNEATREGLITWSMRVGFAMVGLLSIYLLIFGS